MCSRESTTTTEYRSRRQEPQQSNYTRYRDFATSGTNYFAIISSTIVGAKVFCLRFSRLASRNFLCSTNKIVVVQKNARSDASCNFPQKKRRVPITIKIFDPTPKSEARKKTLLVPLLPTCFSHLFGPLCFLKFFFGTSMHIYCAYVSYLHIVK